MMDSARETPDMEMELFSTQMDSVMKVNSRITCVMDTVSLDLIKFKYSEENGKTMNYQAKERLEISL
jgi:hypothetical protein